MSYEPVNPALAVEGYTPIIYLGPVGNPNGSLAADPQTIVIAGETLYIKTIGGDAEGWIQLGA